MKLLLDTFINEGGYLPLQQALTQSCKAKLIWWPHKTPRVRRVGGYSEVIKGETGWGASERVIMARFSA